MSIGVRLAKYLLTKGNLSVEDSNLLTGVELSKLGAVPFTEIVTYDEDQSLLIGGKPLTLDEAIHLRESAITALENKAFQIVCEQVTFLAVTHGMHKAETPEQMYWGGVGVWWTQNVIRSLMALAQKSTLSV